MPPLSEKTFVYPSRCSFIARCSLRLPSSALAVHTRCSSRFGRNVTNGGQSGCPVRLVVFPDPILVHPSCPNLARKHQPCLIGLLMLEYHPAGSCQFSCNSPDGDDAIGFGFFAFIKPSRQRFISYGKMCGL